VLGPVLVNYIREYQIDHGVPRAESYNITMFVLAGLLAVGFICNWLVRPVAEKHYMKDDAQDASAPGAPAAVPADFSVAIPTINPVYVALAWLAVWIPIGWGMWITLQKAVVLFK
jgi:hypothetical protein